MKHRLPALSITLALTLVLILTVLWLSGSLTQPVQAQAVTGVIRVSATHPNSADDPGCGSEAAPCLTIQYAVLEAQDGNEIHVAAGTYDRFNSYGGHDQVVEITETLTLRGGYTTTVGGWDQADPDANPTIVDAGGQGRALYISGDITVTVEGLDLTGGDATGENSYDGENHGGGVYVVSATTTLSDCAIYGNLGSGGASGSGGGAYAYSATLTINDCTIHNNTASTASTGNGGGLYTLYGSSTLLGSQIYDNTASAAHEGYGGGLYLNDCDTSSLTGNRIESNTGSTASDGHGGGVYIQGTFEITVSGGTIADNTACTYASGIGRGGAAYVLNSSNVMFSDNNIAGNVASRHYDGYGGGLWVRDSSTELTGNNLLRNTATLSGTSEGLGGALYAAGRTAVDLTNNMVAQNRASSEGSGLWFGGQSNRTRGTLLHNTISDNGAPQTRVAGAVQADAGQGIYAARNTSLNMTNTILSGHPGAAIYVSAHSTATLEASLWFDNGADTAGFGTITTGTINITEDPTYVDPASGDYHLTLGSPGIDAGVDAGIGDDFDGEPRPARNGYDLGADEVPNDPQLVPDRAATALPGDLVVYGHTLSNTGLITTAFAISHASSQGWDVAYQTPITLAAEDSATLYVTVTVPAAALSDTVDSTVITAAVQSAPSVLDTVTDATTVARIAGVQLAPDHAEIVSPGTVLTYLHTLTNTGSATDTFALTFDSSLGWSTIDDTPRLVGAGEAITLFVRASVPANTAPGLIDTTVLTATSTWDPTRAASATDTTTAGQHHVYLPTVIKNH